MYLNSVENDENETKIIDRLFANVDKNMKEADFDGVSETAKVLPSVLHKRREKYEKDKIEKMRQEYAGK